MRSLVALLAILGLTMTLGATDGEAAGPWKAEVVDADTGTPLEGVVVLAVWFRREASPGGWAGGGYHASDEVVTGPDGRFEIPARSPIPPAPLVTTIQGPSFLIFKGGYGQWRFRDASEWERLPFEERKARVKATWKAFQGEGVVIELPPLRTPAERRRFLRHAGPSGEIPPIRIPRYLDAFNAERVSLGLEPLGR